MSQTDKRSSRRGGFYWNEANIPFATVTTILGDVIRKKGLEYWLKEQVFLAVVQDPTISKEEALNAPNKLSSVAKDRGTTVHSIVEAYKHSKAYIQTVPAAFRGYANAFYDWTNDNKVEILENEKTVFNEEHGYAGTLDLLVRMNQSQKKMVVDVKTGKMVYPEAFLQLSAYKHCLEGVDEIAVLLLQDDGGYQFAKGEDVFEVFLAVKRVWEWMNRDLVKQLSGPRQLSLE
jgi:hypothetical protein